MVMKIPPSVKVKIDTDEDGVLGATLPEYDVFTEADSYIELEANINDLIFSLFDIPRKFKKEIRFVSQPLIRKFPRPSTSLMFESFVKPGVDVPFNWV